MKNLILPLLFPILSFGQNVNLVAGGIGQQYMYWQPVKVIPYGMGCSEVSVKINDTEYLPDEHCDINISDQFPFGYSGRVTAIISYGDTSYERRFFIQPIRSKPTIFGRTSFASYPYRTLANGLDRIHFYFLNPGLMHLSSGCETLDWKTKVYRLGEEVMNQRQNQSDSTFTHFQLYPGDVVVIDSLRYAVPMKTDTLISYTTDPLIVIAQ